MTRYSSNEIFLFTLGVLLPSFLCTPLRSSEDAEERVFAPPTFPYWGPFGLTSTALFCPWFIGPFAGSWNRACAGPVPPFAPSTTTAKPTSTTEQSNATMYKYPHELNYNFPNPFPPPVLNIPYDHSFYPLPNGLAIMAQRQDGQHNRHYPHQRQQQVQRKPTPLEYLGDDDKK